MGTPEKALQEHAAIAEAVAALRAREAKVEEMRRGLDVLSKAIEKARTLVAERDSVERDLAQHRERRRTLMADELLGQADQAAIDASASAIKAAEKKLKDLVPLAQDAQAGIVELEARYAKAAPPHEAANAELPVLHYRVLEAVAKVVLDDYGQRIVRAYEGYLDAVTIARAMNVCAQQAKEQAGINLTGVVPEVPGRFVFPAINLHGFRVENSIGAHATEIEKANKRFAARMRELGAEV